MSISRNLLIFEIQYAKISFGAEKAYPGVAQLVARLTGGQEAASSSLVTRTKSTVWGITHYTVLFLYYALFMGVYSIFLLSNFLYSCITIYTKNKLFLLPCNTICNTKKPLI